MLTWQRQIYSGSLKVQMPNIIYTYTLCPEGRYIYIVGANIFIRRSVEFEITQQLALWIFDCAKLNMSVYNLHYDTYPGRIVDFYSLSAKKCVLLMHNNEMKLLTQYLLLMNKETNDTVEILCRNWKIDASEALRVGYGGLPFGYIVVSGYTTPEFGNVLDVRMLPADPGSVTIPAINMDKQIARLESLIKQYPSRNLYVWPGSVPLISDKGLYFLLTRRAGQMLIYETSLLGAIEFLPDGTYNPVLITVDDSAVKHLSERELCINYVSMLAQRDRTCWMNSVVPSDPSHWRNILQRIILVISAFILLYFGSLLLWLSQIDGGFCAYWFVRAFIWLSGGHSVPNIGLDPSVYIFNLDMDCYRLSTKEFQAKCAWLKLGGHALIDVMNDGSAVMSELTREYNLIRITEFPPPFVPQTLRRQALNKCINLYPKLCSSEMLRLECGIADYPEL
uniref:Uncharacterized protein n=1 Tax=Onchocerca volvulus TaxID=6282 RepID=A0A8R1TJ14_ONCVO